MWTTANIDKSSDNREAYFANDEQTTKLEKYKGKQINWAESNGWRFQM